VFTGDSITLGAKHTHGYHCYPEVFHERVRWEISRYRDIVINTGISGHTTRDILNDFDWRITQFRPSVVSLMIGTNDCKNSKWGIGLDEFEKNLRQLLTKIRDLNAIPVLHTPPIVIKEKSLERVNLPQYVAVIRKIAEEQNLVFVDHYAHWKDTLENHPEVSVYKNWFNDPNHPGAAGHIEIARLMFQKLSIFNPSDPTCGGVYYEGDH
jgi:lysophospholipase L1-like esterase